MKKLSLLRFGTYGLLLAAVAITAPRRYFIEFENFPFMAELVPVEVPPLQEDTWNHEFSQRTNGFNHFEASVIANRELRKIGANEGELFGSYAIFQRGQKEGAYVVVYPHPLEISGRRLLGVYVSEDRTAKIVFVD